MLDTEAPPSAHSSDFVPFDKRPASFLGDIVKDNLMSAVIALGMEVWTIRRRMLVTELVLAESGISRERIEAYLPTEAQKEAWNLERDAFLKRVYGFFAREDSVSVSEAFGNPFPREAGK